MVRAGNRSTLATAAKESRRVRRPSCASDRDRTLSWRRSLRRLRRAVDSSVRLLDSSRRVIGVSERSAAKRPLRASRQLQRATSWLSKAERRVWGAANDLRNVADGAGYLPECDRETAAKLFAHATEHWIYGAEQVAGLYDRLDSASSRLLAAVTVGAVPFDLPGLHNDSGHKAAAPRLITGRLLLKIRLPKESGRIRLMSIRRRRSRPIAFTGTVRRVFRGRAPPHAAICSL
jgi:hypothetical protein